MSSMNPNALKQESGEVSKTAGSIAQEATHKVSEIKGRMQSEVRKINARAKKVDETTIPDAFREAPKYISPRIHSWLDFAVSTYFLGLGVWFASRRRGRAATAAFVNGAMIAGVSALTDYKGDGSKPISFKLHGTLDGVQATMAGLGPLMHGFAEGPEAKYFWAQAANEVGVIATTDWDAGQGVRD